MQAWLTAVLTSILCAAFGVIAPLLAARRNPYRLASTVGRNRVFVCSLLSLRFSLLAFFAAVEMGGDYRPATVISTDLWTALLFCAALFSLGSSIGGILSLGFSTPQTRVLGEVISLVEDAAPNPKFFRAAVRDLWRDRADLIERAAALQLEIFRLEESLTTLRARRQMFERSNIRPPVELDEIERELLGRVKEAKGEYSGLVDSLKAELLARYEEIGRRDLAMLPEDVRVERPLVKVAAVA